jgi:hypothetical protein|eukprot:COSAG01_NODE_31431_length_597_cov_16.132530_1_plen_76_part_00
MSPELQIDLFVATFRARKKGLGSEVQRYYIIIISQLDPMPKGKTQNQHESVPPKYVDPVGASDQRSEDHHLVVNR